MESKGSSLGKVEFTGADLYGHKSLADPDMVAYSWIHCFLPPSNCVASLDHLFLITCRRIGVRKWFIVTARCGNSITTHFSRRRTSHAKLRETATHS